MEDKKKSIGQVSVLILVAILLLAGFMHDHSAERRATAENARLQGVINSHVAELSVYRQRIETLGREVSALKEEAAAFMRRFGKYPPSVKAQVLEVMNENSTR